MALFRFGKKKEEKETSLCCYGSGAEKVPSCCGKPAGRICCIKVLGTGCKSCHQQYEHVKEAVENLGLDIQVEYITNMEKIMEHGVMSMPAIVINDQVAAFGRVLKTAEVEKLLQAECWAG